MQGKTQPKFNFNFWESDERVRDRVNQREMERERYQWRGCGGARPEGESAERNIAREMALNERRW
jgi:hypothetical protein